MANSSSITDFKNLVIEKMVANEEFITAMDNDDVENGEDAIYKYVFPYFYIPETIESAHCYMTMKVDMTSLYEANELLGNFRITIWVIVNQKKMKMSGVGGATRMDYLSQLVDKTLNGSNAFGMKRLMLVSNEEDSLDKVHRCRVMEFETRDVNDGSLCGAF